MHGARRRTAPVREEEDDGGHAGTVCGRGRAQERGGTRRAQCTTHCVVGLTVPVLATASSSVGDLQGTVKGAQTKMVARFGSCSEGSEHAQNRGVGATQSASDACQPPWMNVVTA